MKQLTNDDLATVPIWVGRDGFPGELSPLDLACARQLLAATEGVDAVIIASGAGFFTWLDATGTQSADLVGGESAPVAGFQLGIGDGDSLPGVPLSWGLLAFVCPEADATVLLAQYPRDALLCPVHTVPLVYKDDA